MVLITEEQNIYALIANKPLVGAT